MTFIQNYPIKFNIPAISLGNFTSFRAKPVTAVKDGFVNNPIYEKFGTKEQIENIARNNPRIKEILEEFNMPLKININELEKLKQGHLNETRVAVAKIYSALPQELKSKVNPVYLQEAAMLHDYGKILIPEDILNKTGRLTPEEREIMELHSELGYELLKDKGVSEKTLELIKYHHQNLKRNGYPKMDKKIEYGLDAQILNAADKYTALREQRCYKSPLGKYEALEIIAKDVNSGNISQEVYTALIKGV